MMQYFNKNNKEFIIKHTIIWLSLLAMLVFCLSLVFDDFEMPQKNITIDLDLKDKIQADNKTSQENVD